MSHDSQRSSMAEIDVTNRSFRIETESSTISHEENIEFRLDRLEKEMEKQKETMVKFFRTLEEACEDLVALNQLQETEGILAYNQEFELLQSRVNLAENCLVKAYVKGLKTDTQRNVAMFQPQTVKQCFSIAKLYETYCGKDNKIEEEEVLQTQETAMVECDSVLQKLENVSDVVPGEDRVEERALIRRFGETNTYSEEETILKEPLLLDNPQEGIKSSQRVEIYDLIHENESYKAIESNVKPYCSPLSQVLVSILEPSHRIYNKLSEISKALPYIDMRKDEFQCSYDCGSGKIDAVQVFDQRFSSVTSIEKPMKPLKSWQFKFKISLEHACKWDRVLSLLQKHTKLGFFRNMIWEFTRMFWLYREMLSSGHVEHVQAERILLTERDNNYVVKLYCSFEDDEHLYCMMEINRRTFTYFIIYGFPSLTARNHVDKDVVASWVFSFEAVLSKRGPLKNEFYSFFGTRNSQFPMDENGDLIHNDSHFTSTYCVLAILKVIGHDLSPMNSESLGLSMKNLQQDDGSFMPIYTGGEMDLWFVYSAATSGCILDNWSGMDKEMAKNCILKCLSYDGGFELISGFESYGGVAYCAIASLQMMGFIGVDVLSKDSSSSIIDPSLLFNSILHRQASDGGFQMTEPSVLDAELLFWKKTFRELLQEVFRVIILLKKKKLGKDWWFKYKRVESHETESCGQDSFGRKDLIQFMWKMRVTWQAVRVRYRVVELVCQ